MTNTELLYTKIVFVCNLQQETGGPGHSHIKRRVVVKYNEGSLSDFSVATSSSSS